MTILQGNLGAPDPTRLLLTTSNQSIVDADVGKIAIGKIRLVNITAGAVTVDLEVYDGTTQMYLLKGYSIAANSVHEFYDEMLPQTHILRGLASSNTAIWCHVFASLPSRLSGGG